MSFRSVLIFLIIIATLLITVAGIWYWQRNIYSKEILKLEILGPSEATLAEEVEYIVKYKNNGTTRLENPKLTFEYPQHSLVEETRKEIDLEEIYPGQEKTISFKGRLLGKENQVKKAKAWLSYKPKNLKARYESATTHTTVIKKVPLTFEFDIPSKIESGEEITLKLNYFSNVDYPLSDLRATIEYPSDFEFENSLPEGLSEKEWELGLLNKAEGGRIEIRGKVRGEVEEEKVFKAELGIWDKGEFVLLKKAARGTKIAEPSLFLSQQVNGNPEYIASPGDLLHYEIFFKNIGKQAFSNLFLVSKLKGTGFDFDSLKSTQGEFKKGDNSIIFDWRRNPKLQFLDVGEEGKAEFWIELKDKWEPSENKRPTLINEVYLSQVREEFENKVNSKLVINQKGYFNNEVFSNSGPLPPRVGETTTYLITWQAKNYFNKAKNVKVKAELPSQVELTGKIFPEEESSKFAFDSKSREIVWNIGEMGAGKGVLNDAPNISFQVSFKPDPSQRGSLAEIIGEVVITGEDSFTEETITATSSSITSDLPDDDTVSQEEGIVQ